MTYSFKQSGTYGESNAQLGHFQVRLGVLMFQTQSDYNIH